MVAASARIPPRGDRVTRQNGHTDDRGFMAPLGGERAAAVLHASSRCRGTGHRRTHRAPRLRRHPGRACLRKSLGGITYARRKALL